MIIYADKDRLAHSDSHCWQTVVSKPEWKEIGKEEKENVARINDFLLPMVEEGRFTKSEWEKIVNGNIKLQGTLGGPY